MYDIVIEIDYGKSIEIPCVELIDMMQILPVIGKMKLNIYGKQEELNIHLKPVKMVMCKDGEVVG